MQSRRAGGSQRHIAQLLTRTATFLIVVAPGATYGQGGKISVGAGGSGAVI
jgi:hypothetical protein